MNINLKLKTLREVRLWREELELGNFVDFSKQGLYVSGIITKISDCAIWVTSEENQQEERWNDCDLVGAIIYWD